MTTRRLGRDNPQVGAPLVGLLPHPERIIGIVDYVFGHRDFLAHVGDLTEPPVEPLHDRPLVAAQRLEPYRPVKKGGGLVT